MLKIILIIVTASLFSISNAQYNAGARQISLSNSDVALSDDVFSLFNNPAGLSQMNWREAGIFYSPSPFGLEELSNSFISYHEPTPFGSIAAGAMTYGFDLYRETKVVLGYSRKFDSNIFGGLSLTYHNVSISGYGNDAALLISAGGLVYISNNFRWGFAASNINRATISDEKDQLPVYLNMGFSSDISENFTLNAAVEKDIIYPASLLFGVEYDIIEYLSLRIGFSSEPARYSAGIGINYSLFSFDYAMFTHQDLGFTHQAGLIISFGRNGTRKEAIRNSFGSAE